MDHPPLIVSASCFLLASSIYTALCGWLIQSISGKTQQAPREFISSWSLRALLLPVFLSIFFVVSENRIEKEGLVILLPEFLIILATLIIYHYRHPSNIKSYLFSTMIKEPVKVFLLTFACVGFWLLSYGMFILFNSLAHAAKFPSEGIGAISALFIWLLFAWALFLKHRKHSGYSNKKFEKMRPSQFVITIIIILIFLMAPLLLQKAMDEDFFTLPKFRQFSINKI
jgi:hypothetical protein